MTPAAKLTTAELNREYNVRILRTDFDDMYNGWIARSAAFRDRSTNKLDLAYGDRPREKLDVFYADKRGGPVVIYFHGGYWQRGDKSAYSFVAEPFVANGVDFILVNYNLCPDSSISLITSQAEAAISWIWRHGNDLRIDRERINVSGHSAGGHITGMMLTTSWRKLGADLPAGLVKSGIPLSGLYDLDPLRPTVLNEAVKIDEAVARTHSPMLLEPAGKVPVLAALGGGETSQFHAQTDRFVEAWGNKGFVIEKFAEPKADHFDLVDRLSEDTSLIFRRMHGWLR